jgi:hypothetical protein
VILFMIFGIFSLFIIIKFLLCNKVRQQYNFAVGFLKLL